MNSTQPPTWEELAKATTIVLLQKMWDEAAEDYNAALDAGDDLGVECAERRETAVAELLDNLNEGVAA